MKQFAWGLITAALMALVPWVEGQAQEAQWLAVLKGDVPQKDKMDACRELARVGTPAAIAPLAALLGDPQLAHMARHALEAIPDPAVDDALRSALGRLQGRLLVGVINSIGVRHDAKAVKPLSKLLASDDAEVAAAAALALGKIGSPKAATALVKALTKVSAAAEGCLRCAEMALAQGRNKDAIALYDRVRAVSVPRHVQLAALRGAILARGTDGVGLLVEQLTSADPAVFRMVLRVVQEFPGTVATQALAVGLDKLPTERQALLIQGLGARGDVAAIPALLAAAGNGPASIRVLAISALVQVGQDSALPLLADAAVSDDAEVAAAAKSALAGFPGHAADAAIVGLLNKQDAKSRLIGVELIGRRRMAGALSELLRLAAAADPQIGAASLKVLGDLGGSNEISPLIAILQKATATQAAEDALASIYARQALASGVVVVQKAVYGDLPDGPWADVTAQVVEWVKSGRLEIEASNGNFGDPAGGRVKKLCVDYTVNGNARSAVAGENEWLKLDVGTTAVAGISEPLLAAYIQAQGQPKQALLRLLRVVGGSQALALVRAAATSGEVELREVALRVLCDWPAVAAVPDLEELVQTSAELKFKILALRGYVRLVPLRKVAPAVNAKALEQALLWCARDEERRLVLAALGTVSDRRALALAVAQLDTVGLKEEACLAVVDIAEQIAESDPAQVMEALRKVVQASGNAALRRRAQNILGKVKQAAAQLAAEEATFRSIFNGQDLSGWDGKPGWWMVENGALTCASSPERPCPQGHYLIWKGGQPGDFELRADFCLSLHGNSGIQIRSEIRPDWDTCGYQADMTGDGGLVGNVYHQKMGLVAARGQKVTISAGGVKEVQKLGDPLELLKHYRQEDWNTYRVVCRGPALMLYVNGIMMCQLIDQNPQSARTGVIALQMHPGPPMKVQFKNIRIKSL